MAFPAPCYAAAGQRVYRRRGDRTSFLALECGVKGESSRRSGVHFIGVQFPTSRVDVDVVVYVDE